MRERIAVLALTLLLSACGTSQPADTTALTAAPAPTTTAQATAAPSARVIAIPSSAPNPNVQDPTFTALSGAKAYFGEVAGSGYRIEVPDQWNGDLVLYAHGYRGVAPQLTITNLPVRELAIQQGVAWGASSYRANGYNPEDGVQDTLILRELFKQKVGVPKRTYIYGSSMGGHIVVASLEQYPD
ncbi:MAG: alpha/beta hydrolase, partial [Chloroflexi bacterium]|nr:alpha/beta hydrolase [Chloroflexota bacterium]